jgi:antitoxin FitA-like protein
MVPEWYHREPMDINVKNIDPEVVKRLAEQAAAEGMSQQEWIRQSLQRTAARLSPAELLAATADRTPMTEAEFAQLQKKAAQRRRAALERLGAPKRRR